MSVAVAAADAAEQLELDAIRAAVPGPFKSKKQHYEAILEENDRRIPGQQWSEPSMKSAAEIDPSDAGRIRGRRAPDSPRTAEVRQFLAESAPAEGPDSARARYRRALTQNDERDPIEKWPDASMQRAAGIDPGIATRVRERWGPDTPRTAEVRQFLTESAPARGLDTLEARYLRALDQNDEREPIEKWPDASMQRAAGIDPGAATGVRESRAPDTPGTAEVREFLTNSAPPKGRDSAPAKYLRALVRNDGREAGQKWSDASMRRATKIHPTQARKIREWRAPDTPRTAEIKKFLSESAPADGQETHAAKYRRALRENARRKPGQQWPDESMQRAAEIYPPNAKKIREKPMAAADDAE